MKKHYNLISQLVFLSNFENTKSPTLSENILPFLLTSSNYFMIFLRRIPKNNNQV